MEERRTQGSGGNCRNLVLWCSSLVFKLLREISKEIITVKEGLEMWSLITIKFGEFLLRFFQELFMIEKL